MIRFYVQGHSLGMDKESYDDVITPGFLPRCATSRKALPFYRGIAPIKLSSHIGTDLEFKFFINKKSDSYKSHDDIIESRILFGKLLDFYLVNHYIYRKFHEIEHHEAPRNRK